MRSLAHPGAGDARVISGESGAVTAGLLIEAGNDGRLFRELQLDADSKVLLFSTEGAGDSADYRRITGTEP
jgi:diaminopropionate ammonia-lyase